MTADLRAALRPALVLLLLLAAITGIVYPLVVLGIGQAVFPSQANGSLIRDGDRVIGSTLVGQAFAQARYFNTRPSAAGKGYDAAASSGSNLGPTSKALVERVQADIAKARAAGVTGPLPADLVTASGSGLDPHLSPAAALAQAPRVAAARGLPLERVRALVAAATQDTPIIGQPRVNVLALNRELDRIAVNRQLDAAGAQAAR